MTEETKKPQPNEWWIHSCGRIRYVVGATARGLLIVEESGMVGTANGWSNWRHEPRCNSFDWTEPAPPDPGEGYELLSKGTVLEEGDEAWNEGTWQRTYYPYSVYRDDDLNIYRRKIKPTEVWPKFVVSDKWTNEAYIRRENKAKGVITRKDGSEYPRIHEWDFECESFIAVGSWREVTEAEAKARVKPTPEPLPALVPGIATDRMVDLFLAWRLPSDFQPDGGIVFDRRRPGPTGTNLFTATQARKMLEYVLSVPEVKQPVESPDDWVEITDLSHKLRAGIDEFCMHSNPDGYSFVCDSHGKTCTQAGFLKARCRRKDLPAKSEDPKRIPVRLWVTYRVGSEGGDWPVRCTRADETCENWREIKTPGGFYMEGVE